MLQPTTPPGSVHLRTSPRLAIYGTALLVAGGLAGTILRSPLQLSDCLVPMLQMLDAPSMWGVFVDKATAPAFFRPLFWVQVKAGVDLASGHYFLVFKAFHVALLITLLMLFAKASRVRAWTDLPVFVYSLMVLIGLHTFVGMVWESFPINHYLEIAVATLAALVLVERSPSHANDALILGILLLGALTLETGLLVSVVVVGARLLGARGVSARATWAVVVITAGYLAFRFLYLQAGVPGLEERTVGYGLGKLSTDEAAERFGAFPIVLYGYNVMASVFSVWLSEPRAGVFEAVRVWTGESPWPASVIGVLSSLLASACVLAYAWRRQSAWRDRVFTAEDRVVLLALVVTVANAAIAFAYVKDEVMSAAGVAYALAVGIAAREQAGRLATSSVMRRRVGRALLCAAVLLWSVRGLGVHYRMLYAAATVRAEWADADQWLGQQGVALSPGGEIMTGQLAEESAAMPVVHEYFLPRWGNAWFGSGR